MTMIAPLIASRGLITTEEVDAFLVARGTFTVRTRDRMLAGLCTQGALVRVRRGLYARATPDRGGPSRYVVAARLAPDVVFGVRTALELRGVVPPDPTRCTYFSRTANTGHGPVWGGTRMQPISHPTVLVRAGEPFIETDLLDADGHGPLRVATVARTFVDVLDRPRLTGDWPTVIQTLGAIPVLDLDRVVGYLERLDNATTAAKAGWFLERHQEQFGVTPAILSRLEMLRPRGPHYLSRSRRESGRYVTRWNLVVPTTL